MARMRFDSIGRGSNPARGGNWIDGWRGCVYGNETTTQSARSSLVFGLFIVVVFAVPVLCMSTAFVLGREGKRVDAALESRDLLV